LRLRECRRRVWAINPANLSLSPVVVDIQLCCQLGGDGEGVMS